MCSWSGVKSQPVGTDVLPAPLWICVPAMVVALTQSRHPLLCQPSLASAVLWCYGTGHSSLGTLILQPKVLVPKLMSGRLALSKPSFFNFFFFLNHHLSVCFLFVLRIAPNSLAVAHSHIAAFCWVYFPRVPFPVPCGAPVAALWEQPRAQVGARGSCWSRTAVPTFLFAGNGALGSSARLMSSLCLGKTKGKLLEQCENTWSVPLILIEVWSSGYPVLASLCVIWRGWKRLIWAGLEGSELGLGFNNQRCILPGAAQAPISDSVLDGSLRNGF